MQEPAPRSPREAARRGGAAGGSLQGAVELTRAQGSSIGCNAAAAHLYYTKADCTAKMSQRFRIKGSCRKQRQT